MPAVHLQQDGHAGMFITTRIISPSYITQDEKKVIHDRRFKERTHIEGNYSITDDGDACSCF